MTERRRLGHDIRNGMNVLVLNAQCLPISKGDDLIECLDAMLDATDSIVSLVDQLEALPDDLPGETPVNLPPS
jgi:nitrogen-specific signal transduction histidine kinase